MKYYSKSLFKILIFTCCWKCRFFIIFGFQWFDSNFTLWIIQLDDFSHLWRTEYFQLK